MPNNFNLDQLNNLSEKEKEYALKILNEYSNHGDSESYKKLLYEDYEEIPVDIDTFLTDSRYLGKGLIDEEGRFTVFPYWVETLKKIFPTNVDTAYNTLILTGPIGVGKSLIAVIAGIYMLYRVLCLKDPYLHYGLQPIDKITFSFMNVTIDAAKGVAWDKCQQLLQSSEWFIPRGFLSKSQYPIWKPNKGIELITGSRNNHIIGRCLFFNLTDEANFGVGNDVEKLKEKQSKIISQVDARMQSRFMKGTKLPTLNIIASSKQSENSFVESFIELKKKNNSKTTYVVDEPQWIIRTDKGTPNDRDSFYVAIGNRFLASELLPVNATPEEINSYRERGYTLLKVPPGYREAFETNIDVALTDVAGISTTDSMRYISGVRLNEAKITDYENPFTKDEIEVGNALSDTAEYSDFFDLSKISPTLMSKPLFVHLDMSVSGDKTGIAGTWIISKKPTKEGEDPSKEMMFQLAFSVSIKAPRGYQVSFEKNRNFIRWLKKVGFNLRGVSSDTFQSAQIQQQLKADGIDTTIISVDRVDSQSKICLPYQYLKSAIYERRVKIYKKCDLLTNELVGLVRKADGHIDHDSSGINSKDQSDGFCGSLYNASQHAEEFAYDYGESVDIITSGVNGIDNDVQQITVDFEQELMRVHQNFYNSLQQPKQEIQRPNYNNDFIIL